MGLADWLKDGKSYAQIFGKISPKIPDSPYSSCDYYWNGKSDVTFWTDCLDVIFQEKIEIKSTKKGVSGKITMLKNFAGSAVQYTFILIVRKEQKVSMLILDEKRQLFAKIDEWQGESFLINFLIINNAGIFPVINMVTWTLRLVCKNFDA